MGILAEKVAELEAQRDRLVEQADREQKALAAATETVRWVYMECENVMDSLVKDAFLEGAGLARNSLIDSDVLWASSETAKTLKTLKAMKGGK